MKNRTLMLVALVGVFAMLGVTYYLSTPRGPDAFEACNTAHVMGSDIGDAFELVDETGAVVRDSDVITKPSLVYFGYTFCPDVCPIDSARNASAHALLKETGTEAGLIFITVDPERDTPEELTRFTANFSDEMIGLTGTLEQIDTAKKAYRVYAQKAGETDTPYYLVDHSTQTYLALPNYGVVDFFNRDDSAETVAERTQCVADVYAKMK